MGRTSVGTLVCCDLHCNSVRHPEKLFSAPGQGTKFPPQSVLAKENYRLDSPPQCARQGHSPGTKSVCSFCYEQNQHPNTQAYLWGKSGHQKDETDLVQSSQSFSGTTGRFQNGSRFKLNFAFSSGFVLILFTDTDTRSIAPIPCKPPNLTSTFGLDVIKYDKKITSKLIYFFLKQNNQSYLYKEKDLVPVFQKQP